MTAKDRKADRHARPIVSARLDEDDDRWVRDYAERAGLKIRHVVIAAVRAYRKQVENENAGPHLITTREAADLLGKTKARLSDWDTRHRSRPSDETAETTPEEH